jgi:hypothetical protein
MEHQENNSTSTLNPKTAEEIEKEKALEGIIDVMRRMIEAERNSPEHTLESHTEMFKKWKEKHRNTAES